MSLDGKQEIFVIIETSGKWMSWKTASLANIYFSDCKINIFLNVR